MSNDVVFSPLTVPVLAETEQEHAALEAARARGFAAGYAEGLRVAADEQAAWLARAEERRAREAEAAEQRVAQLLRALRAAAVEVGEATVPVLADAEETLIAAAFELATAVVGVALEDRVAAARAAVVRVLDAAAADGRAGIVATVRMHPADVAALAGEELGVHLVPDPALAPGDATGDLPDGWLDARIGAALERAKEALS
ncbi:FliH/SctL family protein [Leifsonia sp. F6_8S_P_1B]|uniref:FliH/SctL family protein n=1 Tax=Leifsonia williamsii TaxID=3035919 RepID=A0ABT8K7I1_9MICO|nr:FliH/SctL family protein [Leifsonia williamsii]MDN4613418.1 FliH/SctL family protein [Leifsonia williamsii]